MKITWRESGGPDDRGPAVMVFAPDGKSFKGFWWYAGSETGKPDGTWDGQKTGDVVGACPHWSGSLEGELKRKLETERRASVYGILFDLDSSVIRPESETVLAEVLQVLLSEPDWRLTIEGHTDDTGSEQHNQTLSEQRAASVKAYLVAHGIEERRLTTSGFGESQPVADNATELGRAQNRRVELVRN
jgi:OOP family OmpA-OmpF porin